MDGGSLADIDDPPDAFRCLPQDTLTNNGLKCGSEDISVNNESVGRLSSVDAPEQDLFNVGAGGLQPDINETTGDVPTLHASPSISSQKKKIMSTEKNSSNRAARSAALPSRPRPQKTESSYSNQSNYDTVNGKNNAFNAFGDYISFFFQKAKVYEQELERQDESKRDLLDKFRHGTLSRRILTPTFAEEEGVFDESEDDTFDDDFNDDDPARNMDSFRSSTIPSETLEALAAVEAMSSFREFKDVKQQLRHSFHCDDGDRVQMKQKVKDEASTDMSSEEWKKQWKRFVLEKKKTKFDDVAIQVNAVFCFYILFSISMETSDLNVLKLCIEYIPPVERR
jgi:hypothetical protein